MVATLVGFPKLPKPIVIELQGLRGARNAIGHTGAPRQPISQKTLANYLSAAVVTFRFLELFRSHLLSAPETTDGTE
jgi:hypothetical protein